MKKQIFMYSLCFFLLVFGLANAFGQAAFQVKITSNVPGAAIYMDGRYLGVAPISFPAVRGSHTIKLTADGYKDEEKTINVSSNLSVNIDLEKRERDHRPPESRMFTLSVTSNVRGAKIYIDDKYTVAAPGIMPVSRGSHFLRVTADGYADFTRTIEITNNTALNADLERVRRSYTLSIYSDVRQAKVYINDREQEGFAPVTVKLEEGQYTITVKKRGYASFQSSVNLNRDTRIEAKLNASSPQVTIIIPQDIISQNTNRPEARIEVFIDGKKQSGLNFTVERGRHTIRIESGGLAIEKELNCREGRAYTITLDFNMNVSEGED
jgi:hypothetical protein